MSTVRLFVTYGWGYEQRCCYSVVEGASILECIERVQAVCGTRYAFTYTEEDFAGQPTRYGLREIPLQPQTRAPEDIKS